MAYFFIKHEVGAEMTETKAEGTESIINGIREFIIDNFLFGSENEMVGPEESFMENGIIDSTGILELIEHVEETYGITVDDEELIPENLDSLTNLSKFIISKRG